MQTCFLEFSKFDLTEQPLNKYVSVKKMPLGTIPVLLQDPILISKCTGFYVFGPYGSGTNLLGAYLRKYFNCREKRLQNNYWKHVFDWKLAQCKRPPSNPSDLRIIIIKHPVFWIRSMIKSPYDFKKIDEGVFEDPNKPVLWSRRGDSKVFKSAIDYWNTTLSFYQRDSFFRESTICILYEDLLYRPMTVLREIAKLIPRNKCPLAPIYTAAKGHCNSSDRAHALATYGIRRREELREKYRCPDRTQPIVRLWTECDKFVVQNTSSLNKDLQTSRTMVHRENKGKGTKFKQRFDSDGQLI